MKNEEKKELTEEEKVERAWMELWRFALSNINEGDISIDYKDFVEEGKKIFDVKIHPKT